MPCYHPLTAYYSKEIGKSGKRGITFNRSASFSGQALRVPCGQCIGCRLEKSRQWAMRCMHEKRLHKDNCFVTLTYDNEHLPVGGTLVKRDLVLFLKRLRNAKGPGVRFYACGEYGDLNRRPHYHVLLFNASFPDKLLWKHAKRGEPLYTSAELGSYWPFGFHSIGDVTFDSAAYVARYVMKKVTGPKAGSHYDVVDGDGVVHRRIAEFTNMSRGGRSGAGGIGKGWFDKYGAETYAHDSVVMNGRLVRPPRYYDGKFEVADPSAMADIKRLRKRRAALQYKENLIDRRLVREKVQELNLKNLKREV
ncbi:MAG: replication initiator protein [Microviridae sp.]|nr:MAG: replication initiator protein [Microviridae sp.]